MHIKYRNIFAVLFLFLITFGLYGLYWIVSTKGEINQLGARIPTAWLAIIPIVHLYFAYKYAEGFSAYVKKDNQPILWFLLILVIWPAAVIFVQAELNKLANG